MGDELEESAETVAKPDIAAELEATEAAVEEIPEPLPEPVPDSWMAAPDNGEPKADVDPEAVEAAAARYLATRDPRAAATAPDGPRHPIKEGNSDSPSHLHLPLIPRRIAHYYTQRFL